jgi:peroxisomal membrane protein 4
MSVLSVHVPGVCPHTSCLISVLRGVRNGFYYGTRVRAPHAFVMTFLFREGKFKDKMTDIIKMTYEHGRNLAMYVGLFKLILCILRHLSQANSRLIHFISGAISGCIVFGVDTAVNSQINMYVLSRIVVGGAKWLADRGMIPAPSFSYRLYSALVWGFVMLLFEFDGKVLQKSLVSSMDFLYHQSDSWPKDLSSWFLNW